LTISRQGHTSHLRPYTAMPCAHAMADAIVGMLESLPPPSKLEKNRAPLFEGAGDPEVAESCATSISARDSKMLSKLSELDQS
jgi:hypothetical protein